MDPVGMFWGDFLLVPAGNSGKPPLDMMPKQLSGGPRHTLKTSMHGMFTYIWLMMLMFLANVGESLLPITY